MFLKNGEKNSQTKATTAKTKSPRKVDNICVAADSASSINHFVGVGEGEGWGSCLINYYWCRVIAITV